MKHELRNNWGNIPELRKKILANCIIAKQEDLEIHCVYALCEPLFSRCIIASLMRVDFFMCGTCWPCEWHALYTHTVVQGCEKKTEC